MAFSAVRPDLQEYIDTMEQNAKLSPDQQEGADAMLNAKYLNHYIGTIPTPASPVVGSAGRKYEQAPPAPTPVYHKRHHKHRWYKRHHLPDPYEEERYKEGRRSHKPGQFLAEAAAKPALATKVKDVKAHETKLYLAARAKGCKLKQHKFHICVTTFEGCCIGNACTTECDAASGAQP